ncbi:MAG: PLP-dependent aminotransferase family protein [Burkholderiales bacterium]|nr:PLP-dependent aminotransferase family protein [Burkholderiales bacterium]
MNAPHDLPERALLPRRDRQQPLSEALAGHFADRIAQRGLAPGARLPSVRDCARSHRVSPTTVVAAYDQLQAKGLVEARRQRGFFVREAAAAPATVPLAAPALQAPVDATALIRAMFHQSPRHRALRRVLAQGGGGALHYGDPAGDQGLRQALSRRLGGELGIATEPGQIVTTVGATHALELVVRTLLRPGDAVLVDEPGWAVEFARLARMGVRLLPVPRGAQGPDLAVLQALAAQHRPRLYLTVSALHNPTGNTLSLAAAHQILKIAESADLTIVEDDTYAWLAPPHAPRLSALDGLQRTVYVSGFSKILAPNWRVGYLAAAPALAERLIDSKLLMTLTSPAFFERAVAWCLDQGLLRRHAERVVQRLDAARSRVVRQAEAAGCRFVTPPQGLFGWVDTGVDTDALGARLAQDGWLIAPGSLFHATQRPGTLMRVNFASAQDTRFWQAFEQRRKGLPTHPVSEGNAASAG